MTAAATEIVGGWHIKTRDDGMCIDVLRMLYNYRVVLSHPGHLQIEHGWCYYGHGTNAAGQPRTMHTAMLAALLAANAWDGYGAPAGFDKQAI